MSRIPIIDQFSEPDVSVPPATVRIERTESVVLVVGSRVELACRSGGSRPHAAITWWIDNQNLQGELCP